MSETTYWIIVKHDGRMLSSDPPGLYASEEDAKTHAMLVRTPTRVVPVTLFTGEVADRKLKRCPFRGCEDVYPVPVKVGSAVGFRIFCENCGYYGPTFRRADLAVAAWNHREEK